MEEEDESRSAHAADAADAADAVAVPDLPRPASSATAGVVRTHDALRVVHGRAPDHAVGSLHRPAPSADPMAIDALRAVRGAVLWYVGAGRGVGGGGAADAGDAGRAR